MIHFDADSPDFTEVTEIPEEIEDENDNSGMGDTESEIAEDDEVDDESDTTLT